jgi:phosphoglycerate dehydrogenase-like enzyme
LPGCDGYIAGLDEINKAAIYSSDDLQVIARYGVGTNNIDLNEAKKKGIVVTNTPGANTDSVAELTVGLILNLIRPIFYAWQQTQSGGWPRTKGLSLVGKTIGIYGLGAIGKEVAKRLCGFDCRLFAYDIAVDQKYSQRYGIKCVNSNEIIELSDVITLHLPVTDTTRRMVNSEFLSSMKQDSFLVNTSRGELIDEDALYEALEKGRLAGAALDVFQDEPPGAGHPLASHPKVIATPHMGAHTDGAMNAMGEMALHDCLAVLKGEEPQHRVV